MKRSLTQRPVTLQLGGALPLGTAILLLSLATPAVAVPFLRGDVDASGSRELTDAVRLLGHLFLGSPDALICEDAADGNDDGALDLSDGSFVLGHLFLGTGPIPPPSQLCGDDPTEDALDCGQHPFCQTEPAFEISQSAKERNTSPTIGAEDYGELVTGNTAFALDLYQWARATGDENFFYSPHSISVALAMTFSGAREQTALQIADVLHYTLGENTLHHGFNALDLDLAARGEGLGGDDGEAFELTVANSVWGQRGFDFFETFLDTLAEHYGGPVRLVDFVNEPEPSRETINEWVEEQTRDRIKDLIPPGAIKDTTRLVLTNAIFFKASWKTPFSESSTREDSFNLLDGGVVTAPFMTQDSSFGFYQGESFQAIELPYAGDDTSMVVFLPDAGSLGGFENSLDPTLLGETFAGLRRQRLLLSLPKFEFEYRLKLKAALIELGMRDAFDLNLADFSGIADISQTGRLFIQDALHKAFIGINEAGTEAAAATAVIIGIESAPPSVAIDRPFVFAIRDVPTNSVLFIGRVLNPAG